MVLIRFADINRRTVKAFFKSEACVSVLLMFVTVLVCKVMSDLLRYMQLTEMKRDYCLNFDSIKCKNGGLLELNEVNNNFECVCAPQYDGEYCDRKKPISFVSWVSDLILANDVSKGGPTMWWSVLPFTSDFQLETIYAFHQNILKKLNFFPGAGNKSINEARILPPARPLECPADKNLPSLTTLHDEIFVRKPDQFKHDPNNRNLLYHAFHQYFVLQFFNVDFDLTVTASQLYGINNVKERSLRSFSGGKLKTQIVNNEHYPSYSSAVESKGYLKSIIKSTLISISNALTGRSWLKMKGSDSCQHKKWAVGHPWSSINPMVFAVSTLWVREHNRVCDVLSLTWPAWSDEQIYTTARRIVTGQMMTIMMNEIVNEKTGHAFPLKLKPEVFHRRVQDTSGSINTPIELLLTMTVSSLPERFKNSSMASTIFDDHRNVLEDGLKDTLKHMVGQKVGMVGCHNDGAATEPLTKLMMKLSRENALQSFNNYRRQFGLPAYDSFYSLTRNAETASQLANLYETVDDVELLTGIFTEGTRSGVVPTVAVITDSFVVNSILTNDLTSEIYWKPDTFGGNDGFDMVKSAKLESLVCRNIMDGECDGMKVQLYAE